MFRSPAVAAPLPVKVEVAPELLPLSVLSLDLPEPSFGWPRYLTGRGIEVVSDDIGRLSVGRADARQLLDEHREREAQLAQHSAEIEQRAVEADQQRRSQIWGGIPADRMPSDAAPASVMLQAAKDAEPRRSTPLEEAFGNSPGMAYHQFLLVRMRSKTNVCSGY